MTGKRDGVGREPAVIARERGDERAVDAAAQEHARRAIERESVGDRGAQMPPPDDADPLPEGALAAIEAWIAGGANP